METEELEKVSRDLKKLTGEIQKVIIGQEYLIERLLITLLCNQHVLIEGVPGLAKTLTVTTMADALNTGFRRIQFTPDLLPADLLGTLIYNPKTGDFSTKKGPLFTNIVLADEINRAPAKVQSALLEAMQERQITLGEETHELEDPFMVLATQNPVEQEGTYPLPEAQVDRFMMKLQITYPARDEELRILREQALIKKNQKVEAVITPEEIRNMRSLVDRIHIDEKIEEYIVDLVLATRQPEEYGLKIGELIQYGASPRATIYLTMASRAHALISGRDYVTPHDVKSVAYDVLRHRVIISYEAEAEEKRSEDIIKLILDTVKVP
ncbi:AAA family ATPase [Spirochaeta isovalerica]|uniref:MoxR-like ATPase n=1 Tax=Spirochaeta isovalerica TaxID=150 RepID=A0A841R1A5_9SPIO|nr:MoxR family ATPase [Spirochaeta isovalerica]MBB6478754.1 MoxR-like ATPase [Spirochaeta isovalerica]